MLAVAAVTVVAAQTPDRFGFGQPAPREVIAALDIDVRPDGTGLPPGRGTAREGAAVYATQCAACHGAKGEGGAADPLVGADPKGVPPFGPAYEQWRGNRPDVPFTIGNYWPYATTVFDYVRRAMPPTAPGSLTSDETYAVVAWLLAQNGIIGEDAVMSAETLPKVVMPARTRFAPDDRKGGRTIR
ncbi:MAG: cytochrome c [Acidobacteria bacterium]|nr:cytochrome c [Acidobacteriota bacterium]